jgi:hypothetical protein
MDFLLPQQCMVKRAKKQEKGKNEHQIQNYVYERVYKYAVANERLIFAQIRCIGFISFFGLVITRKNARI